MKSRARSIDEAMTRRSAMMACQAQRQYLFYRLHTCGDSRARPDPGHRGPLQPRQRRCVRRHRVQCGAVTGQQVILVMADHDMDSPLWDARTESVGLDRVEISRDLQTNLEAWSREYRSRILEQVDWSDDAYAMWIARGRRLARMLQYELGDAYEVRYSEHSTGDEAPTTQPRRPLP